MTDAIIQVEGLGKRYILGQQQDGAQYQTLREGLVEALRAPLRRWRNRKGDAQMADEERADFWALRDVNFEVKRGEVVGIIGRNGAGKSTLLKILSRITEPTTGRIRIGGRVASLLEVGTGFHPELTGRENIFLNGAILGMHRAEIKAKFDEIVAFAEVERFLDTPVKRYSSGMYVRLAFAVAAHLEPEILVVDEVLAVGDAQFQKKCLGKMQDVSKQEGRTILFVSHQMSAVESLCSRGIVLGSGSIMFDGSSKAAVRFFLNDMESKIATTNLREVRRRGSRSLQLTGFSIRDDAGHSLATIASGDSINIVLEYEHEISTPVSHVNVGVSIHNQLGDILSIFYSEYAGQSFAEVPPSGRFVCTILDFPFSPGRYYVGARVLVNGIEADWPHDFVGVIDVEGGDFYGSGAIGQHSLGPILLRGDWKVHAHPEQRSLALP